MTNNNTISNRDCLLMFAVGTPVVGILMWCLTSLMGLPMALIIYIVAGCVLHKETN